MAARWRETIAALATPPGVGAIAIVRVSGEMTREVAGRMFRSKRLKERVATYGTVVDESGGVIDKAVALLYLAPHTYTGEDVLELHVHGSPAVAREVLRALIACGVRAAQPGEFTLRAFLNGKMDLHSAAAVADLIEAQSRSAVRAALANLSGGLASDVRALRDRLASMLEELAAAIDFPDEVADPDRTRLEKGIADIADDLEGLLRTGEAGRMVREGVTVAIVGPPNAGKSSLLNALLGEDRAIVSDVPGTTRDTIEESLSIDGIAFRLIDTAGIRAHADRLEGAGIERTRRALEHARVALVVVDGSAALSDEARAILEQTNERARVVYAAKADLGIFEDPALPQNALRGSVHDANALASVRRALVDAAFANGKPDLERPHLAAAHEFDAAARALEALARARQTLSDGFPIDLAAPELQRAFSVLGHVTGDEASEELLSGIFSRFCIGK